MKSSLKCLIAATASVVSSAAFASNLENPLYMPKNREVYLKAGAAIMYKTVEKTDATVKKDTDGNTEFPVWRFAGDIGYGITDRLDIHGRFGYTKDGKIDRKGMHRGRIGLMYRLLEENDPFILDLYADAYLSGVTPMKGTYTNKGFNFSNYSNGRWGAIGGVRFGKQLSDWTLAGHAEYLQTFGNHNNKIGIDPGVKPLAAKLPDITALTTYRNMSMQDFGFPDEIAVDLKSTHETVAGFDVMYQMNQKWSFGAGFEYIEHYNNGVKGIHTKLEEKSITFALPAPLGGMTISTADIVDALLAQTKNMKDGWDEYVLKVSAAYQVSENVQFATFFEYTMDDTQSNSQNATDCKLEWGIRLNTIF